MRTSHKILLFLTLSFLVAGVADIIYYDNQDATFVVHAIVLTIGLFFWCGVHAFEHDLIPPSGSKIMIILAAFIGVPYYLIRGFGFKTGGVKYLKGIAWYLGSYLVYFAAFQVTGRLFDGVWPELF